MRRTARLCKADLLTEVVGEFPELQGLMGKYYALAQGEDPNLATACEDHYRPLGPNDRVPTDPVSVTIALADKVDTLIGFWAIDEKPTGSKDPYALRRAALGVIRIILTNDIRLRLFACFVFQLIITRVQIQGKQLPESPPSYESLVREFSDRLVAIDRGTEIVRSLKGSKADISISSQDLAAAVSELLIFFADRLKVQLREQGARHDLVDAVFALEGQDDLVLIVRRVEALGRFLDTEDGKNLLAGYKRATSIIRIEEKRDAREYVGRPDPSRYRQQEEWALSRAIDTAKEEAGDAVAKEDFEAAMRAMAKLRPHVDAFFDKVTVNVADGADKQQLRENRLKLLNEIREATRAVADFARIEGG